MNEVLLRYDIPVPNIREPFEFYLPKPPGSGALHVALTDQNLVIHLVATSAGRTYRYRGQLYGVCEPFVRPEGGWATFVTETPDGLPGPLVLIATPLDVPEGSRDRDSTQTFIGILGGLAALKALGLLSQPEPDSNPE